MNNGIRTLLAILHSIGISITAVSATNYYVDPATGAIGNSGSQDSPWNTLEEVASAKTFSAGDTVFCLSGYHGRPALKGTYTAPVVFKALPGAVPVVKTLSFPSGKNIVADGFTITADAVTPYVPVDDMVNIAGATFVTVQNCSVYSVLDASGWTEDDWDYSTAAPKVCGGFEVRGAHSVIRNNYIKNVRFGIRMIQSATATLVEYNTIRTFSEDGMRALPDSTVVQYNRISGALNVNLKHADCIQSWATPLKDGSDTVYSSTFRGNQFFNWEADETKGPLQDYMMGLGFHDGMFKDFRIENNLIVTDATVGMQLLGAVDCQIVNNTVLAIPGGVKSPWIGIMNHKQGHLSTGNIVRNNITSVLNVTANTVNDHNLTGALGKVLVADYNGFDFTLKPTSAMAIDAGSDDLAPAIDIVGTPRPAGAVDIGCFEYVSASVRPAGYTDPDAAIAGVHISPFPATERSVLSFDAKRTGIAGITVRGIDGANTWSKNITVNAGTHRVSLTDAGLQTGIYTYEVTHDDGAAVQGYFIVQ